MTHPFTPAPADGPADGARFRGPFSGPRIPGGPFGRRFAGGPRRRSTGGPVAGPHVPHRGFAHKPDEPEAEPGRGRGGRRGGFGPGGFGPGGFGPGGFGPGGFGPGGFGFGSRGRGFGHGGGPGGAGGPGWRHRRSRRGNVRAAILALLAEEPRHGYSIMTELAERSGGLWRPSPGSIYPVLAQLQDEGLVSATETDGRRVFALTDAGREHVAEHADELREPWVVAESGPVERVQQLVQGMAGLGAAVEQVARLADDAQTARALAAIDEARRTMYRILAGDEAAAAARAERGADPADEEPTPGDLPPYGSAG